MTSPALDAMALEIECLRSDFASTFVMARDACQSDEAFWRDIQEVVVVGQGDSFHAGIVARSAFLSLAGVCCRPALAYPFALQPEQWLCRPETTLVIAVSASGSTQWTQEAMARAVKFGARGASVSGRPDAPLAQLATLPITIALADKQPSPGIRSFQASLTALLAVALCLGTTSGRLTAQAEIALVNQILRLGTVIGRNADFAKAACRQVAAAVDEAPVLMFAGSWAAHGIALYAAAKATEAAGLVALGQDLEEWWHVERFGGGASTPLVVIAPPDQTRTRALDLVRHASRLQRRVTVVAGRDDAEIAAEAEHHIVIDAAVPQPLVDFTLHPFAASLAHAIAVRRGREPFALGRV